MCCRLWAKDGKGPARLDQEHVAKAVQGGTFVQGTPFWALAGVPGLNHTTAVERVALESQLPAPTSWPCCMADVPGLR